jgi:hypothetical protein
MLTTPFLCEDYSQYTGLRAGSELVTANFEYDFLNRFRDTGLPEMPKIFYKARQAFDLKKMGLGEEDEDEFWDCPVEGLKRHDSKGFQDGHMRFTR